MNHPTYMMPRGERRVYAGLIILITLAGLLTLATRSRWPALGDKAGDALWAMLVFLVISFVWPHIAGRRRALIALTISCMVEFSQLYHAPWIDRVRGHFIGRLFLGVGFDWLDLISYAAGIGLALAISGVLCLPVRLRRRD
jgi:hypothetical protein